MGGSSFTQICLLTLISVGLKFTLGSDDVVWLSPFLAKVSLRKKAVVVVKYVLSVAFLTLLACLCSFLVKLSSGSNSSGKETTTDKIISTCAGALLAMFSLHMAYEEDYFESCLTMLQPEEEKREGYGAINDEDDEEEEELGPVGKCVETSLLAGMAATDSIVDTCCPCIPKDEENGQEDDKKVPKSEKSIVIVAFLGSMDDFIVYFTLALSGHFAWFELSIGVTIGAILLGTLTAILLESSKVIADCVAYIPVPLVLFLLSVFIVLTAWTPLFGEAR